MFCLEEFNKPEIRTKLNGVVMNTIYDNPLKEYSSLNGLERMKYNKVLNNYINLTLVGDDWYAKLTDEFNEIVSLAMNDIKLFNPEKQMCPVSNENTYVLKDEHKEQFRKRADEGEEYAIQIIKASEKGDAFMQDC
jgi:hypothetical protein